MECSVSVRQKFSIGLFLCFRLHLHMLSSLRGLSSPEMRKSHVLLETSEEFGLISYNMWQLETTARWAFNLCIIMKLWKKYTFIFYLNKAELCASEAKCEERCFHRGQAVLLLCLKMKLKLTRKILCKEYWQNKCETFPLASKVGNVCLFILKAWVPVKLFLQHQLLPTALSCFSTLLVQSVFLISTRWE